MLHGSYIPRALIRTRITKVQVENITKQLTFLVEVAGIFNVVNSGYSFLFALAMSLSSPLAFSILPCVIYQRMDSGVNLNTDGILI